MQLHNTLTGHKEEFVPLDPEQVTMYVCGPTVYSYAHIGNARPVIVFDVLSRVLRRRYANVVYVRNITDIDDKINAAAKKEGVDIRVISDRRSEEHTSELQSLMRISYAVFCLKKKTTKKTKHKINKISPTQPTK